MGEKKKLPDIVIPTLKIDERIQPVLEKIYCIISRAERISAANPLSGLFRLPLLYERRRILKPEYDQALIECYDRLTQPVSGPGMTVAFAQAWSTAKGIAAISQLREAWHSLDALLDRKSAYSIALLSLYIAVIALVITAVAFFR